MAHSRGFRGRSQVRAKRMTAWDSGPETGAIAVTGVGKSLWTTGVVLASASSATIVRVRGEVTLMLDLATGPGDGFTGALGIGIVSSDAFTVGQTAVPGPESDPDWNGWLWHQYYHMTGIAAQSQGENVGVNSSADILRIKIDSKAMRIIKSNEIMFGMFERTVEAGTAGMRLFANTRVLLKLA